MVSVLSTCGVYELHGASVEAEEQRKVHAHSEYRVGHALEQTFQLFARGTRGSISHRECIIPSHTHICIHAYIVNIHYNTHTIGNYELQYTVYAVYSIISPYKDILYVYIIYVRN